MSNYMRSQGSREPISNVTPLEAYLTRVHGNLHDVIPHLVADEGSLERAANALSDDMQTVSYAWVRRWLLANGYTRVSRWERDA